MDGVVLAQIGGLSQQRNLVGMREDASSCSFSKLARRKPMVCVAVCDENNFDLRDIEAQRTQGHLEPLKLQTWIDDDQSLRGANGVRCRVAIRSIRAEIVQLATRDDLVRTVGEIRAYAVAGCFGGLACGLVRVV